MILMMLMNVYGFPMTHCISGVQGVARKDSPQGLIRGSGTLEQSFGLDTIPSSAIRC